MTSTMYSVVLLSLAWNAEGSNVWGFCASQGNYLKLIGGFTSADFRIGELVAADYAGSCHTGMFAASAQNMSSTGAFYRRTGALFATETYCDASASTSCQCVGAPRCLAQKRCPYDCGCSLSEAGAVGVNSYFSGRTALEFTGAFLLSGASLTSNFTCRATWTSSEFIKGYSLTVTPVDVESKTCLTDKKLAAHNQYTCALSLIKGSTNLTAGEAFVQAFVLNGAESRGAGALATALLAALFVAASLY